MISWVNRICGCRIGITSEPQDVVTFYGSLIQVLQRVIHLAWIGDIGGQQVNRSLHVGLVNHLDGSMHIAAGDRNRDYRRAGLGSLNASSVGSAARKDVFFDT